jgi:hypothetical protein
MPVGLPLFLQAQTNDNAVPLIKNMGQLQQTDGTPASNVVYYTRSGELNHYFLKDKVVSVFEKIDSTGIDSMYRVDMVFENCNANPTITGLNTVASKNFYTNTACLTANTYKNLSYTSLYTGINLISTSLGTSPQYQWDIATGASISTIKMKWVNATSLSIVNNNLIITTPARK